MLHRFTFHAGQISYANKFLHSEAYRQNTESGEITFREFATDPCRSIFKRISSVFVDELTDNANVNFSMVEEKLIAMTETPMQWFFDPETLEAAGVVGYQDSIKSTVTTAHPHRDRQSRNIINFATKMGLSTYYSIFGLPPSSRSRDLIAKIPVGKPSYMHSFALTERYVILAEFPLRATPIAIPLSGRPFIENFKWTPEDGTRFIVVDMADGKVVVESEAEPFFAFHHVNAFEDGDQIVVDAVSYDDSSIIDALYLDKLRAGGDLPLPSFRRYRIPMSGGDATEEVLSETAIELPRINYGKVNARPYRYVYGAASLRSDDFVNAIAKIDLETGDEKIWHQVGCYPGEPVFIAAPDAEGEDSGILATVVLDSTAESSFLLVLDSDSFVEICRTYLPHHIPFGFHGQFVPDPANAS